MPRKAEPRQPLANDERALWQAAMRGAVPLKGREPRSAPSPPAPTPAARPAVRPAVEAAGASPDLPALGHDRAPGLDKRTWERLKGGLLPIEARIDLHGMSRDDAHRALTRFVLGAQEAGRRCVLVITGRGLRAEGAGVLRAEVPRWLNLPPLREKLLAFCPARPKDGGAGALYLLLKRQR
jgi:DNA-nicking Smr family endonuclease